MVPLQRNAHPVGRQEVAVRQRRWLRPASRGSRVARCIASTSSRVLAPARKDPVNTGVLIRLEALFRFSNAPTAQGTRAAKNDQGGVLTCSHGTTQFPQHFFCRY